MARAVVLTYKQADALKMLKQQGTVSATDFDRDVLESCVLRGWVTKNHIGHAVTYTINGSGLGILRTL